MVSQNKCVLSSKYLHEFMPPIDGRPARERYHPMRDALNATGRPIVYSICNWVRNLNNYWGGGGIE